MKRIPLVALVLVALFLLGSCASTSLIEQSRTVSVQGSGVVTVTPDVASLMITVSEIAETTAEAQQMTNEKVAKLLTMIRNAGVEDKDVATTALSFSPEYRWRENEQVLIGQRVRQSLSVTVRGIGGESPTLPTLLDSLGTVSHISIGSIRFSKADTSEDYVESRKLAMEKAIQKASDYAEAAGMRLGKPLTVSDYSASDSQSVRNSMVKADAMMMMESAAPTELPTGEITISSSVSVVFELL